jgi:putative salt-induced outer membrane protein
MRVARVALLLAPLAATPAYAEPIPDPIRAMIDTAIAGKDSATIAAILSVAKRTAPGSAAEIDAIGTAYNQQVSAQKAAQVKEEQRRIAEASPFSLWKGEVELGGSWSTGVSSALGLYGSVKATRDGIRWSQNLTARADYQEQDHITNTERVVAAYQPHYKLEDQFYIYGLAQYEHDRFLGYRSRYTGGVGVGITAANRPDLKIDIEAGPGVRHADYYEMAQQTRLAARGSFNLKWQPSPGITFTQESAMFFEKGNTTATSTTALDTRLFGPLKARISYNVQYERDAPQGQKEVDTISRASLVYVL